MFTVKKLINIGIVLVIGVCVQVLLTFVDISCVEDSPNSAAAAFTRTYFKLDTSMSDLICKEYGTIDAVDTYLQVMAEKARDRGFGINFMKNKLYHIETETHYVNGSTANVRITGKRRTAINPVYAYVANLFNLGEIHDIDEILNVVKEEGRWKVCEDVSSVFSNSN